LLAWCIRLSNQRFGLLRSVAGRSPASGVLGEADLSGASLDGADLSYTTLSGADLRGAYLGYANLSRANLSGAKLSGAKLRWADLKSAEGLTQEQVDSAIGDSNTQLPENLHMPESWKK
jgi:uncharacterized protein YjbI with pentapeptide repeats